MAGPVLSCYDGSDGSLRALPDESELDAREEATAREAAAGGVEIAELHGWVATARVEHAVDAVWQTVVWVADEIDAPLIVCGARGRNAASEPCSGASPRPCSITVTVRR